MGVVDGGGGELAAMTTSASMAAGAESSTPPLACPSIGGGDAGTTDHVSMSKSGFAVDGKGAHASVLRRRSVDFARH